MAHREHHLLTEEEEVGEVASLLDPTASFAGYTIDRLAADDNALRRKLSTLSRVSANLSLDMPQARLIPIICSLFMSTFLASMDTTVVTTLLIHIASDLNSVSQASWIATSYLLSCSAFQPLFGKLSDIFGRRTMLIFCLFCFALGCLVSASNTIFQVSLGRFITGIGGGGMATLGTITMSDIIPLRKRGLYQGLTNIVYGVGAASGGTIGGFMSEAFGWRSVFICQVPIAILVGTLFWWNLDPKMGTTNTDHSFKQKLLRIDFLGSGLLISSIICLLIAASLGGPVISFMSLSFVSLIIFALLFLFSFVYVDLYKAEEPIIPIELLKDRTVLSSCLANWFYSMSVFTYLFYVPIYYSSVLGFSASQNGLRLIANFFGISCGSISIGVYMKKTGKYYNFSIVVGIICLLSVVRIYFINPKISIWWQYLLLFFPGAGYACMLTVTLLCLISTVPTSLQASTTSIQYTFRSTGSTLGVAISSAIFRGLLRLNLKEKILGLLPNDIAKEVIKKSLDSSDYVKIAPKIVQGPIRESYGQACKGAFAFSVITIILGFVSLAMIRENPLQRK